jgi:tetratricopeptide (TPR) repeat protein
LEPGKIRSWLSLSVAAIPVIIEPIMSPTIQAPHFALRDASHVISGFAYQLLTTIARWIELNDDSTLACEYGEDIYVEAATQSLGQPTTAILMEQVKQRGRNVTLQDKDIAKALVDFVDHLRSFPEAKISFRLSTNAAPGKERLAEFPDGVSGIDAWNAIRDGKYTSRRRKAALKSIRLILAAFRKTSLPGSYRNKLRAFHELISDDTRLLQFIMLVELSVGGPAYSELTKELAANLVRLGYSSSLPDAQRTLYALMNELLMMLNTRGLKTLTKHDLLRISSDPRSLTVDTAKINLLLMLANQNISELQSLRVGQHELSANMVAIGTNVEKLLSLSGSAQGFSSDVPSFDPPPRRPRVHASRKELVKQCLQDLATETWLAVVGEKGCGKSLLAANLIQDDNVSHRWISLSGRADADVHLERQLTAWAASCLGPSIWTLYASNQISILGLVTLLGHALGDSGRLVIDDLPDHNLSAGIQTVLTHVARTFEASGSRLVTTSHRLAATLTTHVGVGQRQLHVGSLSSEDIREMLVMAGSPAEFDVDRAIPMIHAATSAHPSLVAMAIDYVSSSNWPSAENFLFGIFTDQPLEEIKTEAWLSSTRLLDDPARVLLARLSLAPDPFDEAMVEACARATPNIPLAGEVIAKLKGAFLTEVSNGRLSVTALLRGVGRNILAQNERIPVHKRISGELLKTKVVKVENALNIATHLYEAHEYARFTLFLIQLMMAVKSANTARALSWLAHINDPDDKLDNEHATALRLGFAAEQYRMQVLLGENATTQLEKVQDLIQTVPPTGEMNQSMVLFALMSTGVLFEEGDRYWALEAALRAIRLIRSSLTLFPIELLDGPLEEIFVIAAIRMRGRDQVGQLFQTLATMTKAERLAIMHLPETFESFQAAIDSCWSVELEKPAESQDWAALMEFYDGLIESLSAFDEARDLTFAIVRAKAVALGDYADRLPEALSLVAIRSGKHEIDFLMAYTEGCLISDRRDPTLAVSPLREAAAYEGDSFLYYRLDAKRRLAVAYARLREFDLAESTLAAAIKFTRDNELMSLDRAELLLELAWIYKATDRLQRALGCLYATANEFLRGSPGDIRYQEAYVKAVYGMPWFWYSTTTARSVFPNWAGGVGLVPGMFAQRFTPKTGYNPPLGFQPASLLLFAGLAASIHAPALSRSALQRAIQVAGDAPIPAMTVPTLSSVYARLGQPTEAIQMAVLASAQTSVDYPRAGAKDVQLRAFIWHTVIGPLMAEVIAGRVDRSVLHQLLDATLAVDSENSAKAYWRTAISYLDSLVDSFVDRTEPGELPVALADYALVPQILRWIVTSVASTIDLREALVKQGSTIAHVYEHEHSSFQMLPGICAVLVRFWNDVIENRSFAIRSPALTRSLFHDLTAEATLFQLAPRLILWASDAIDIRLDKAARLQMIEWGT